MNLFIYTIISLWISFPCATFAQDIEMPDSNSNADRKPIFRAAIYTSAWYVGSLYILGQTWYKDKPKAPFHFFNDNKAYLQVDKFGHIFGSYMYSYIGYRGLLKMGATRKEAFIYGSTLGFVLQLPIEIMDGIHEGYGFSWGDVAANTLGSGLVMGQELLFNEQVIKYKFSYWESPYSKNSNGYFGKTNLNKFFNDYNGHTYWFSIPVNKMVSKNRIPDWLSIAVGYSANGMYGEFDNITSFNGFDIPKTIRYRQYLLSLDIDWTRIHTNSRFLNLMFKGLTFVKLPFPAVEYNSRGEWRGYWMYY